MRVLAMRAPVWAGLALSVAVIAACSAFWDDPSLSLRSGPGDDPVLDLVIENGEVVSRTGPVVTDGQWSQHPSHIALTRGDVFDVRDVMPDTTRGATIAFRLDVTVESEFPGELEETSLCLISTLYRPGSPDRLAFIVPVAGSRFDEFGDIVTIEEWTFATFHVSHGSCPDERCWGVPSARGPSIGPYVDSGDLDIDEPRWAAVTLNRNGNVSFFFEGEFLENSRMWSLSEFSREFGAFALIPSVSCDFRNAEWMRDTEFDPVKKPIESAGASSPFTFEISAIRVFDYALTGEQLERLPNF